jgi:hypothetical protein
MVILGRRFVSWVSNHSPTSIWLLAQLSVGKLLAGFALHMKGEGT